MTIITEGQLIFGFDSTLSTIKYDDSSYYKRHFQNKCHTENKAVDIIAYNKEFVWLIEIKDFRNHGRSKEQSLCEELSQKIRDTLAGLFGAKFYPSHSYDEKLFFKGILACQRIYFVLHMEQDHNPSKSRRIYDPADIKQKLKSTLKAINPRILIINKDVQQSDEIPWSVQQLV